MLFLVSYVKLVHDKEILVHLELIGLGFCGFELKDSVMGWVTNCVA